ncbi:MAG: CinA family nicotinamide mononucleotide deamidase-related protein [Deltaproteobacteria bacterium]|nr:MAG: CinA family nicotinamide mononucleotide deamidase-related protein [Deltaproteobacteria bacterium]
MKTEFIGIGSELLYGKVQDTNGSWLAKNLHSKGLDFQGITLCKDEKEDILESLERALKRSDVIFISGGLGPTQDDVTKKILADYFGKKIVESEIAASIVQENYQRYGKEWKPDWNHYHHIPEEFEVFDNPKGLAPGLGYYQNGKTILAAPGVPKEFRSMVDEIFLPWLTEKKLISTKERNQIVVRTHGVPEEMIFNNLAPTLWEDLSQFGSLSSLPQVLGIDLVITLGEGSNENEVLNRVKDVIAKTELSHHVWQWGNLTIEELLVKNCNHKGITFSFAESCTGGLSSHRITNVSGSSGCFMGSAVTYSNQAKQNILSVDSSTIKKFGAVSKQTAEEMAKGSREEYASDIAISWTGIAGPSGGTPEKPVGTLAIGWATSKGVNGSEMVQYSGDRDWLKKRFSEKGLLKLLELVETY